MNHIIEIKFKPSDYGEKRGISLSQWDTGDILRITGVDIPTNATVEVHFSLNENAGTAKRVISTVVNGVIEAFVPTTLILEGTSGSYGDAYRAYAWIYVCDEYGAKTTHKITFNVRTRPRPDEYVSPEEPDTLAGLKEELNGKIGKEDIPKTLPNPHALTFTGAVKSVYDGSKAVTIEIPSGNPAITEADEGKFLCVVDGIATWQAITNGNEVAY